MNVESIIKAAVEESVTKSMREALSVISEKLIENLMEGIAQPKYDLNTFLTEEQVSEILNIKLPTLRRWRQIKNFLPYSILTKKVVRYQYKDVVEFALSKKVQVIKNPIILG